MNEVTRKQKLLEMRTFMLNPFAVVLCPDVGVMMEMAMEMEMEMEMEMGTVTEMELELLQATTGGHQFQRVLSFELDL